MSALQHPPKCCLLDDANLPFQVENQNGLGHFYDYFQILGVVTP